MLVHLPCQHTGHLPSPAIRAIADAKRQLTVHLQTSNGHRKQSCPCSPVSKNLSQILYESVSRLWRKEPQHKCLLLRMNAMQQTEYCGVAQSTQQDKQYSFRQTVKQAGKKNEHTHSNRACMQHTVQAGSATAAPTRSQQHQQVQLICQHTARLYKYIQALSAGSHTRVQQQTAAPERKSHNPVACQAKHTASLVNACNRPVKLTVGQQAQLPTKLNNTCKLYRTCTYTQSCTSPATAAQAMARSKTWGPNSTKTVTWSYKAMTQIATTRFPPAPCVCLVRAYTPLVYDPSNPTSATHKARIKRHPKPGAASKQQRKTPALHERDKERPQRCTAAAKAQQTCHKQHGSMPC